MTHGQIAYEACTDLSLGVPHRPTWTTVYRARRSIVAVPELAAAMIHGSTIRVGQQWEEAQS